MTEPQDTGGERSDGRVGLVGKTLGRYRLSAELGRGGMATVYRAFDPQLQREVAVKVMHGAFTGRGDIERRFRREAQAVAALRHDCIVDVFDFAPGGDGEPAYIVSELVEGPTLRGLVENAHGRVVPEIAAIVGARVAAALGAAHARGIIHRDVKPDNVMLDLGSGKAAVRVLLTDFGIARMTEDDTMTATGSILGSPSYMSPEQAKSGTISPASDIFSLGVTLYHLVTGRTPFPGKDPLTAIAALVAGEFPRPTQLEARVSPELEAVILRCLKRAPEERYADGTAAGAALRAIVDADAIGDEGAALRAFHADRAAFERTIGGRVAEGAVERARACVRRAELTRALAHLNRAMAYAPGHRGAAALLSTISSRRRWVKSAAAVAVLLAAGGAVAGLGATRRAPAPSAVVTGAPPAAAATARPAAPPPLPAAPPPAATARTIVEETATPRAMTVAAKKRDRPRRTVAIAPPAAAPPAVASAPPPPPTPVAVVPAPPPPVEATPARVVPAPAPTAGITLRARQGFCSPSLDDRQPALRPIYEGVAVGRHNVYCTPPGSARVLAGSYELRAGTHPDLIIVPGPDGKPTLSRPE